MLLRRIEIQSFRGVRAIDLALDDTTLLIGENASGKTSVLAAVQTVLAPESADPHAPLIPADIHRAFSRDADGPGELRIALTFVQGDESPWPDEARSRLGDAIRTAADGRPLLCLELTATPAGDTLEHRWRFRDSVTGDALDASPEQVETLRRCAPVAMLDPGALAPREGARAEPADEIGAIYRRITHQRSQLEPDEIREAAELAGGVAARMLERIGRADTPARRWLADIAALRDLVAAGDDRRLADLLLGAGSRMLSLLALAGAALRTDGDGNGDHATPLLCVDTPEARLHPLSLAPLWDLLQLLPGQKIVTTNSGDLLAGAPLDAIRRLVRAPGGVRVGAVQPGSLDDEGRRRISYHIRTRRGGAFFARSWLLVEGETEFWLLPELARTLGYDFAVEGVKTNIPALVQILRSEEFASGRIDTGLATEVVARERTGR